MEDATLQAIKEFAESLRSDMQAAIVALDRKCDAIADSFSALKKKADGAGERARGVDSTMAERVAADSVGAAEFSVLSREVADLRKKVARPQADLNAYADVQSKADAVMRTHNERAEPPMAGEDIVAYKIRQHRPMQKFSPKWKGVELGIIAADGKAFENVLAEIRTDALQAGMNPVGLPEFAHREITEQMPGGHLVKRFVGTGTIFKQLSRPVRHVAYIGTRN
ncbi:hypothetical protein QCM80_22870 [Bradyrhizobium sp. SSUT112]|uniref:hypothetical protein n=1 Tax=Bradyrhizobium sp. SSUT112 TaxID=3040604 RepID=UPI002448F235|nr:hypothetical protein [Bradyrhizobium sp. SSUT112]MDH2353481.1 hypothetical protein [Bradyrhizobium sp. SSUT112]